MTAPLYFDEFFASGKEETISPFLTPASRTWGKNLSLRSALAAAACLALAFAFSFISPDLSALFLISVYFLSGTPALINAVHDLRNLEINIDVLMTLAALLSVLIGSGMEGGLLLVLFEVSAAMEDTVARKTRSALLHLHALSPRTACVIASDGTLFDRSVREIEVGTLLLVKAGEIVPLDGQVKDGSSFVNLVHLTGESEPISKKIGDEVPAGAGNLDGTLTVRVTRASADSTLSRIIKLITQAQETKPQIQRFLDRFGKYYATTIIFLAALFAITLPWIFGIPLLGSEGSIYRALTFLIAASPCALIIATPTAYLSAISSCAKRGILLKGGVTLDAMARSHIVAFDKTGTLTTGELTCTEVKHIAGSPFDLELAIAIAATLERHAVHPIAEAITTYAHKKGLLVLDVVDFKSTPGFGLEGVVASYSAFIGHRDFILKKAKQPLSIPPADKLTTYLLVNGAVFAFHFIDTIRPQAKEAIERLKKENLEIAMLSGDHASNAIPVAKELGIDTVFADLRPEDKLAKVGELSKEKGLIMVGDGINDAPALARATVGVSMGKIGSATAVDASDIVFLNDDLSLLDWLYHKAHQTMRIVRQNLTLALGVIVFATTPALLGIVPLWVAVILHEGGTVLVGLNSLRLLGSFRLRTMPLCK
jgi:heavy metal translocating P-type ATPase